MIGKLHRKGTESVNPQFHDEFVALGALFYAGELTDEEWALLQVHLAYCDTCRSTFEQYNYIASDVIPAMAASAAAELHHLPRESESALAEAERRLMSQLGAASSPKALPATQKPSWRVITGALAACAVVGVAFASVYLVRTKSQPTTHASSNITAAVPSASATAAASNEEIQQAMERAQQEVTQLRQQLAVAEDRAAQPKSPDPALQHRLEADHVNQEQLAAERDALSQQLAAAQVDAQSLRDKLASTQENADQQSARSASLEAKVHELNAALDETNTALNDKDRILALDKDFLAHDRDIRDLIGARNLYIADIFDTNEEGKTAKPFGRIFYTQDRSLVFYGFDLDKQAGLKKSVAFQAWGTGSDKQPISLGLFYQDDSQKRWVLRCNDAKTLARMDMVFVTIEPPGGSAKPTGKQLLRAYLQIQPNHL
jgi:anti-sigma-K factor RskA